MIKDFVQMTLYLWGRLAIGVLLITPLVVLVSLPMHKATYYAFEVWDKGSEEVHEVIEEGTEYIFEDVIPPAFTKPKPGRWL